MAPMRGKTPWKPSMNRSFFRKVLECASPLALATTHDFQSVRGLAHFKTLTPPGSARRFKNVTILRLTARTRRVQ